MTFYNDEKITIRAMKDEDAQSIYNTLLEQNWHPNIEVYKKYYKDQELKVKYVFVAEYEGNIAGYTTLLSKATKGPFVQSEFPEIVDLCVFEKYQNKGIANKILDIVENIASDISNNVTLSVGLHSGYGAAQRIYVKRGYIPDGSGVWYNDRQLEQYSEKCSNDDSLVLYFSKQLR
ncbi:GNAT family N-acetyltransferase [Fusibacter bizertensis]|uniref:GNAT family N-acetyltransferase n=1 Tax=Fusibacter bizertensis TaxID=1488331 RepID=A0ABT6NHM6_9FIRM|nr:GNAT family N-acetyltransferase [Fusibacter bizertensis]MDH8679935.1 GNAT family N-acetyltransferase [Fusibacter bizertensis]